MEFGRVEPKELGKIDLDLPKDPPSNKAVLAKSKSKKPQVHVGCAKWGRKDWVGKIYPKGTKEADFLDHYAKHFSTIELNATFYQVWKPDTIAKWVNKTGDNFRFCPKFYQGISHWKRLKDAGPATDEFFKSISGFGKKLDPVSCSFLIPLARIILK
jgi:uncharacterized protein YecE (DUF72 family)